ncbi:MAG: TIGR04076 family protein [Pseudomonadota bacterium]
MSDKDFELFDLRVETISGPGPMVCNHPVGSYFLVQGENLIFPEPHHFPLYALAALLPLLPAKQRPADANDWMSTDAEIACPDPHCGGRFRITRTGKRRFTHAETTGLPDARGTPYWQKDGESGD